MPIHFSSSVSNPAQPQTGRGRRRSAFTFIEILTVFVIFGLVTMFGLPKLRGYREQAALRSAKQHLSSSLSSARAAAIRRGRAATFAVSASNSISVSVDSSGVQVPLATSFSMKDVYGTTMPAGAATVTFDRRGFALALAATQILVVANSYGRDSVCVTRLGVILVDGCTP